MTWYSESLFHILAVIFITGDIRIYKLSNQYALFKHQNFEIITNSYCK